MVSAMGVARGTASTVVEAARHVLWYVAWQAGTAQARDAVRPPSAPPRARARRAA
jgi:hypothetical protein